MGKDNMYQMFEKFGIGEVLGVDFLGESGGIVMDYNSSKVVDIARMGFGQAVAMTPLQLINAICSIVNGGTLNKPYFLSKMTDRTGKIVFENFPTKLGSTISEKTSGIMRTMMIDVIKQYSWYYPYIPGYTLGGKTGTSEKYGKSGLSGEYIASFVGVFPGNNPDYVILVVADEPQGVSYYGSIAAMPYAKMVIENIIKYKGYTPERPEEITDNEIKEEIVMPNVIGLNVWSAINELEKLGMFVETQGTGDIVVSQFPKATTCVAKGGVVMIECE
jgi:stage V sporulation protein D (sporulation-specific penicillin-binding protein)